jgi:tetratricopeptide (TPR) repeat protein
MGQTKLTKSGTTVGTTAYMSPEQVRGEELDARSDIFSLGVTFYELLTGASPFAAEHDLAIMHKIQNVAPPSLRTSGVSRAVELEPIIGKMLAKEPRDRYQTLSSVIADIAAASPRPEPNKKKRWLVTVGLAVAVVATVFLVRNSLHPVVSDADAAIAVMDFSDTSEPNDKLFSSGLARLISTGLIERSSIRVVSPELIYDVRRRKFGSTDGPIPSDQALMIARKAEASLMVAGERVANTPKSVVIWRVVDVASGRAIGSAQVSGSSVLEVADLIVGGIGAKLQERAPTKGQSLEDITTNSPEAYRYYIEGILASQAGRAPEYVRDRFEKALAIDTTFALAALELSRSHAAWNADLPARRYADLAWRHRERLGAKDLLRTQAVRQELAHDGRASLATSRQLASRWPDDAAILGEFCGQLFTFWEFKELADLAPRLLALYPNDAVLASIAGSGLQFVGRDDEAIAAFRRTVRLHPEGGDFWDSLGRAYTAKALFDSSSIAFGRALETIPPFMNAHEGIAEIAYCKGDLDGAISSLESALPKLRGDARVGSVGWAFKFSLSVLLSEAGRFTRSIEVIEEFAHLDPLLQGSSDANLTFAFTRAGQWERVLECAEKFDTGGSYASDRVRAYIALDSLTSAQRALDQFARYWDSGPQVVDFLRAKLALASGDTDDALKIMARMQEMGLPRPGPYDMEVRDYVARAQAKAGRLSDAAHTLEDNLRLYQGHALGHYELAIVYESLGNTAGARKELETFLKLWEGADAGLTQTADARARLSRLKGVTH